MRVTNKANECWSGEV